MEHNNKIRKLTKQQKDLKYAWKRKRKYYRREREKCKERVNTQHGTDSKKEWESERRVNATSSSVRPMKLLLNKHIMIITQPHITGNLWFMTDMRLVSLWFIIPGQVCLFLNGCPAVTWHKQEVDAQEKQVNGKEKSRAWDREQDTQTNIKTEAQKDRYTHRQYVDVIIIVWSETSDKEQLHHSSVNKHRCSRKLSAKRIKIATRKLRNTGWKNLYCYTEHMRHWSGGSIDSLNLMLPSEHTKTLNLASVFTVNNDFACVLVQVQSNANRK